MNTVTASARAAALPQVIQGGMGVGVSSWQLARAVAQNGGLGVVSGVANDLMLARWLQDGDDDGVLRSVMSEFPDQDYVSVVLDRYLGKAGRPGKARYRPIPRLDHHQRTEAVRLTVLGAFVQVRLAKRGHDFPIGINLLEKIQIWTPATLYGAMLADVDVVLVGAGVPTNIPRALDDLAAGRPMRLPIDVTDGETSSISLDPDGLVTNAPRELERPAFLAIISSHILAGYRARDEVTTPDGFVIEGPTAGGHNAPPRRPEVDEHGEVVYGPRDEVDLGKVAKVGLPFWLAGGRGTPEGLREALELGAHGVQIGTVFALSRESGLTAPLRQVLFEAATGGGLHVRTDAKASPTGFPFKVAPLAGTIADDVVRSERERLCDLGYLRELYQRDDGTIGTRCPSEPIDAYVHKGGKVENTEGRYCLCNGLTASAGIGQVRADGYAEAPLLTLGHELDAALQLKALHPDGWSAADVMQWLTESHATQPHATQDRVATTPAR
jgi:NAD(P)H-dependent flavin oxidoreductase YrpB (nitropropane dioxygenase family)